ncbi:MAG: DUF932 domain-containing protein [Syntrophorhabdaceae bacterium]|nr:DUF932 domain-containing protein [Syntrophorhabdaceae bacterium]
MPHLIESIAYVGQEPWHGLGKKILEGKKLSIAEAIVAAGLNWDVELRPLYTQNGPKFESVRDRYAVCRQKDGAALGVVGSDYTPLQNKEAFAWFQPFLDTGDVTIETAGSLKGGSIVWVLAQIGAGELHVSEKDQIAHYILLSNSHDGSLSVRVGFTPIRVVCNNTLSLAHESHASKLLRVKHTARVIENLEHIRQIMDLAHKEFYATIEQYRVLREIEISRNDLERYVRIVFDLPETGGKELIPNVAYLLESGRGSKEAGKTYWGAYNAVTEYLNYFRGKTQDSRLSSLWFGDSSVVNKKALHVAIEMAA